IALGSWPATRFSAMDAALGCWKWTDSLAPILNDRQSMMRRSVDWSTRREVELGRVRVAEPAETVPPCGKAQVVRGDKAAITRPAAAKPLAHLSKVSFIRTAGVRLLFRFSRRSDLAFQPVMKEPP